MKKRCLPKPFLSRLGFMLYPLLVRGKLRWVSVP